MPHIHSITKKGGSGAGTASWGPDFGGLDGDQFEVGSAISLLMAPSFAPITQSASITELRYDAVALRGADSAVNDGPDAWTNPTNATGLRNAVEASRAGQALVATDGNLRLGYADFTGGIENFTITLVQLRFDTRQTGTVLNNGGLHHEYRLAAGAWTSLQIFVADIDNNPITYDITAAVGGDWAKLNALEVRVRAVLAVGTLLVSCLCDAVEVRVVSDRVIVP